MDKNKPIKEQPPILGNWRNLYVLVLLFLVAQIALYLYLSTRW